MDLTGIDYLGIDRVLKRGTGKVIERHDTALLVHDRISGTYMLGCGDAALGADVLRRLPIGLKVVRSIRAKHFIAETG